MSNENNEEVELIDLDTLSDEEVDALSDEQVQALQDQQAAGIDPLSVPDDNDDESNEDQSQDEDEDEDGELDDEDDLEEESDDTSPDTLQEEEEEEQEEEGAPEEEEVAPEAQSLKAGEPADTPLNTVEDNAEPKPLSKKEKAAHTRAVKQERVNTATQFYDKITAPFKADGKEIKVRSAEDAIKFMQQGINYSNQMRDLKPLKALSATLQENDLMDPVKLNFLIDVSKGKPEAIQQLLKQHSIDPMDLDPDTEASYTAPNYQKDPKEIAFKEAIDETMKTSEGRGIIGDINKTWDDSSKNALREEPAIFNNLLEQQRTGVYDKIKRELVYQNSLGYLTEIPFLQAYHQVGEAMEKAGLLNGPKNTVREGNNPIANGPRKAAAKPKAKRPNPNLTSASQPQVRSAAPVIQPEPDYSNMSDEEFAKLPIPL